MWGGLVLDDDHINREAAFYDEWADTIDVNSVKVDEFFEACTAPENRYILKQVGSLKGKKVLDLGCGMGDSSVYFAKKGASVVATDVSEGVLKIVHRVAKAHHTSLKTQIVDAEKLPFEEGTFDFVYAANMLHHVDPEKTIKEAARVLKKGGYLASWDPLAYNPLINIYRRIATKMRTEDETPMKMNIIKIFRKHFGSVKYTATWFFTLWIFIKFYLIDRIDPNKEKYWKKIIYDHKKLEKSYNFLEKFDRGFLKLLPFMKRFCWNLVVVAKK